MNFLEAVKAMKEGKKVRRKCWSSRHYFYLNTGIVMQVDEEFATFTEECFEATDWEIVVGKKTLSDKIIDQHKPEPWLFEKDVKEANKKFIDFLKEELNYSNRFERIINEKAKEIYGERLI